MQLQNIFRYRSFFFVTMLVVSASAFAGPEIISVEKDDKAITLSCGESSIISYHHAVCPVPEGVDPVYQKSGFIHPLYSPSGKVLTRIQPPDHYHHYGIWAPWTKTHVEGKQIDFWNLAKKQGTVRFAELLSKESARNSGSFKVRQEHVQFMPEGKERVVMNEVLQITASADNVDNNLVWVVDIKSEFENMLDSTVVLDQYRYGGGIGFRATEKWSGDNCTVLTSEGKTRGNADGTRARWCDVNGSFPPTGQTSGILFMSNPENHEHPEPMRIWNEKMMGGKGNMFFEFCPIRLNGWKVEPGKKNVLSYRMVVYDGKLSPETAEVLWQSYVKPKKVSQKTDEKKILIYTKNGKGFVHKNIPASIECLEKICRDNGWAYKSTADASVFTKEKISEFDVLVFSNTNNETFDTQAQKDVFKSYINNGGGFVGIHSACGSERDWPWFWANLGGKFEFHPPQQEFDIISIDKNHISTKHLPDTWKWFDECYFLNELNPAMRVLIAVDLRSLKNFNKKRYSTRRFGDYFPLAWCQEFDGGRQWYTALGHNDNHYEDENFIKHLTGGIKWAMDEK